MYFHSFRFFAIIIYCSFIFQTRFVILPALYDNIRYKLTNKKRHIRHIMSCMESYDTLDTSYWTKRISNMYEPEPNKRDLWIKCHLDSLSILMSFVWVCNCMYSIRIHIRWIIQIIARYVFTSMLVFALLSKNSNSLRWTMSDISIIFESCHSFELKDFIYVFYYNQSH